MVDLSGPALLDMLTPSTREWMATLGKRRDFADGELIHARGDRDPSMYVVIQGSIKLVRLRRDGSQSLVSMIGPGQHTADLLLMADLPRTHAAIAVGPVAMDQYDRAAFEQLTGRQDILFALYRLSCIRLNNAISMVDDLRTLSREAHLAKLMLAFTSGADKGNSVDVVQEDLAAILGVSAMTLAKSLAVLKREGLIETGYRQVRVPCRDRLRQWLAAQEPD